MRNLSPRARQVRRTPSAAASACTSAGLSGGATTGRFTKFDQPTVLPLALKTVLAWVNGHTHVNDINPRMGPTPERSFWEINTASHIDFPQHARLLEVVDNQDST